MGEPFQATAQMDLTCPHCQAPISVPARHAGESAVCPSCQGRFRVPMPEAYGGSGSGWAAAQSYEVREFASKKIAAGVCGIMFGGLGVHKFILGFPNAGIVMLMVSLMGVIGGMCIVVPILATMTMSIFGLVEGIIYLTKSDQEFYETYAVRRREWF